MTTTDLPLEETDASPRDKLRDLVLAACADDSHLADMAERGRKLQRASAVLFPWSRGCPHRDAAAAWVMHQWWAKHHPDIPQLTTGDAPQLVAGPWSKGLHLTQLLDEAPDGTLVISDVDVWTTPSAVQAALAAIHDGAPWAIPHRDVYRLTPNATKAVLEDDLFLQRVGDTDLEQPPYPGHPGGGIVILRRRDAFNVPLDPRFEGWGQEDDSWGLALTTILGQPWRGTAPLSHLWHPPQPRRTRAEGSRPGVALYRRYLAASHHPGAMRALLAEVNAMEDASCCQTS